MLNTLYSLLETALDDLLHNNDLDGVTYNLYTLSDILDLCVVEIVYRDYLLAHIVVDVTKSELAANILLALQISNTSVEAMCSAYQFIRDTIYSKDICVADVMNISHEVCCVDGKIFIPSILFSSCVPRVIQNLKILFTLSENADLAVFDRVLVNINEYPTYHTLLGRSYVILKGMYPNSDIIVFDPEFWGVANLYVTKHVIAGLSTI